MQLHRPYALHCAVVIVVATSLTLSACGESSLDSAADSSGTSLANPVSAGSSGSAVASTPAPSASSTPSGGTGGTGGTDAAASASGSSSSSSGGAAACSATSGYCPAVSVLPATVKPGSAVTISGSIVAAAAASGMI